jgi:hypothetical protein
VRTKGNSDILFSEAALVVTTSSWFSHLEACITRTSGIAAMLSMYALQTGRSELSMEMP